MGCFLEYLYTGEYFPRKLAGQRVLESDPSLPEVDDTGDQLLKHARVYTLAEKYGLSALKTLASSKIHCVNSTARGEIAYARYVYTFTGTDDSAIRAPVASFWATRSHTLRAEAEDEFKALCLEHPQFGYDVLSTLYIVCCLYRLLTVYSTCPGRQAQEGAQRQGKHCHQQWAQTAPPEHWHLSDLRSLSFFLLSLARHIWGSRDCFNLAYTRYTLRA